MKALRSGSNLQPNPTQPSEEHEVSHDIKSALMTKRHPPHSSQQDQKLRSTLQTLNSQIKDPSLQPSSPPKSPKRQTNKGEKVKKRLLDDDDTRLGLLASPRGFGGAGLGSGGGTNLTRGIDLSSLASGSNGGLDLAIQSMISSRDRRTSFFDRASELLQSQIDQEESSLKKTNNNPVACGSAARCESAEIFSHLQKR